jgi:hypothetical protein
MKGDFHVRFWNSGRKSDLPADCNPGSLGKPGTGEREAGSQKRERCEMHLCSIRSELERLLRTGEPDALKGARPVRWGAVGNVPSCETTRSVFWQV